MSSAAMIKRMRPLVHPSIDDITVEGILHALSDPVRVAIYAELAASACATICSNFLQVRDRSIPKSTLSQHFRALREAGLVRSERHGVEMHNVSRCKEIEQRFPGLLPAILNAHSVQARGRAGDARRKAAARKTKAA
jgi:DNA-binding transcriptional ArsR family regulator